MLELVLSYVLGFNSSSKLAFTILKQALAKYLETLIEVFHRKDDSGATGKRFHLGAPVTKFGQE